MRGQKSCSLYMKLVALSTEAAVTKWLYINWYILCRIPCSFSCYVFCANLAFMWSAVECSKHSFWAMSCPVNMYCDRGISCIVNVTYHVLTSVQSVSYAVSIQCKLISLRFAPKDITSKSRLYCQSTLGLGPRPTVASRHRDVKPLPQYHKQQWAT